MTLPYGRQLIEDDDVEAVVRVLRSDFLTTGPEVEAFEKELAAACGAAHVAVVSNGTAALHCAYAALGLAAGDEVITTPLTFSATANMVLACGAKPVFVDVDPVTLCIDPAKVERAITPRAKAIAAVDYAGLPAPVGELTSIAKKHGLAVVEDAAHSVGGRVDGKPVGSLATLTTFSFHPVKTFTTAEGGAVATGDAALARKVKDFRNHGMVRDADRLGRKDGPWYYEVQSLGFNYRLTDLQCALGRSQLRKLPRFVARRAEIVARYREEFAGEKRLSFVREPAGVEPAWHLFTLRIAGGAAARAALYAGLQKRGIGPQVHYIAVNDLPLYRGLGHTPDETPIARDASASLISLPLFPGMADADVARVIAAVHESLDEAR